MMATTQQNRLMTLIGFILVLLVILVGSYFYVQKIGYENELKLNAMREENVQLSERNKVLMNREKGSLDQLSIIQKENESLKSELSEAKQLNEALQQEKMQLTKEIETLKAVNAEPAATTAVPTPLIPLLPME